jgi:hypothetical protein
VCFSRVSVSKGDTHALGASCRAEGDDKLNSTHGSCRLPARRPPPRHSLQHEDSSHLARRVARPSVPAPCRPCGMKWVTAHLLTIGRLARDTQNASPSGRLGSLQRLTFTISSKSKTNGSSSAAAAAAAAAALAPPPPPPRCCCCCCAASAPGVQGDSVSVRWGDFMCRNSDWNCTWARPKLSVGARPPTRGRSGAQVRARLGGGGAPRGTERGCAGSPKVAADSVLSRCDAALREAWSSTNQPRL